MNKDPKSEDDDTSCENVSIEGNCHLKKVNEEKSVFPVISNPGSYRGSMDSEKSDTESENKILASDTDSESTTVASDTESDDTIVAITSVTDESKTANAQFVQSQVEGKFKSLNLEGRIKLSGAARKRLKWLVKQGHSIEEARSLTKNSIERDTKERARSSSTTPKLDN